MKPAEKKGKRGKIHMLKHLPFATILSMVFVLPGFSDVVQGSMCDIDAFGVDNGDVELEAVWEPVSATCTAGKYFSAEAAIDDNSACVICPVGFYCPGVTAAYDGEDHGKEYCGDGYISVIGASSSEDCIQQVICNPGTYLPGESVTCVQCPENNYCPGDTFMVQTEIQGLTACTDGLKSPAGSRVEQDCGRVLKVRGDDNVERVLHLHADKRTEPSLVVKVEGVTYYADTTPISEGVKTLDGRDVGEDEVGNVLRIKVNDVEYSVHETIYE